MNWVRELCRGHLEKSSPRGPEHPAVMEELFRGMLKQGSLKILVQEPWMGTIRFKTLACYPLSSREAGELCENPMEYLAARYGGGKFKINFYHGLHFVGTKNFKPQGEPRWQSIPELAE